VQIRDASRKAPEDFVGDPSTEERTHPCVESLIELLNEVLGSLRPRDHNHILRNTVKSKLPAVRIFNDHRF